MEMLFELLGLEGCQHLGWCHGRAVKLLSEKNLSVIIEWDEECLGHNDQRISSYKLVPSNWNPKKNRRKPGVSILTSSAKYKPLCVLQSMHIVHF